MNTIVNINRDQAKAAPETEFEKPEDVTSDVGLTRAEKLTVLRNWAFEVQRRLDAAGEGMAAEPQAEPVAGPVTDDTELLRRIEVQIGDLEQMGLDGSD